VINIWIILLCCFNFSSHHQQERDYCKPGNEQSRCRKARDFVD